MFHSLGTVQSKTAVPDGTSKVCSEIWFWIMARVRRIPSPVMLRQIGYNSFSSLITLFKFRIISISFRDHFYLFRPSNPKCWIIKPHSPGRFRALEFRHLIENFSPLFQGQKAVRASLGHVNHVPFFSRQDHPDTIFKFRRLRTQVEDYVVYCSPGAAYQFGLRMGRHLIMHAAQRSLSGVERHTALHQLGIEPMSCEFLLAPGACKEPALVEFCFEVNFENSG